MRLGSLEDECVLDLYAGCGTLGIEALSRGARRAVFVDSAARSIAVLRANLADLSLDGVSRVVRGDVIRSLRRLAAAGERFDLVLLDPPYAEGADAALEVLARSGVLAPGARVVSETAKRQSTGPVAGLVLEDARSYGDTVVTRWSAAREAAVEPEDGPRGPSGP